MSRHLSFHLRRQSQLSCSFLIIQHPPDLLEPDVLHLWSIPCREITAILQQQFNQPLVRAVMLADMIQRRFLLVVGRVDPTPIDSKYELRRTIIPCHGAVVERLPFLVVLGPYELGMVVYM